MLSDLVSDYVKSQFTTCLQQLNDFVEHQISQCPYCASERFSRIRAIPATFRCYVCHKYFNHLSHTPFNRLPPIE